MKLNDKVYDVLKWVTMIFLPAVSTLYFALATVWGWPYISEVMATFAAITMFLGALIGVSTYNYNK